MSGNGAIFGVEMAVVWIAGTDVEGETAMPGFAGGYRFESEFSTACLVDIGSGGFRKYWGGYFGFWPGAAWGLICTAAVGTGFVGIGRVWTGIWGDVGSWRGMVVRDGGEVGVNGDVGFGVAVVLIAGGPALGFGWPSTAGGSVWEPEFHDLTEENEGNEEGKGDFTTDNTDGTDGNEKENGKREADVDVRAPNGDRAPYLVGAFIGRGDDVGADDLSDLHGGVVGIGGGIDGGDED